MIGIRSFLQACSVVILCYAGSNGATPVGMGADGAAQLKTPVDCSPDKCEIGDTAAIDLSADPDASNRLKTFKFADAVPFGDDVIVIEHLVVGNGRTRERKELDRAGRREDTARGSTQMRIKPPILLDFVCRIGYTAMPDFLFGEASC